MKGFLWFLSAGALAVFAVPLPAQQEVPMRGTTPVAPQGIRIPPLPDAPVRYETAEGQNIRVSVYARGFRNPWSMAFVSDDTILVAERGGAIRAVRNGVVDPQPVPGGPVARGQGLSGMDLALHPEFDRNRAVYISYTKPLDEKRNTLAVARAIWDGKGLIEATDIFVGEGGGGGPIAFGGDGMLYVASGGGGGGPNATQTLNTIGGKVLRLTDTGAVPKDNPFVGRADARPEVFTMGHRNTLRMAKHPSTGAIWQIENGPNGGDEANILVPGANYGWPIVSLGRTYAGPWQGPFSKEGFRDATSAMGAVDRRVEHRLLHGRPSAQMEGRRLRERHALRRDSRHRAAASDSDQQESGRAAAGASADRSAAAHSRREAGT